MLYIINLYARLKACQLFLKPRINILYVHGCTLIIYLGQYACILIFDYSTKRGFVKGLGIVEVIALQLDVEFLGKYPLGLGHLCFVARQAEVLQLG